MCGEHPACQLARHGVADHTEWFAAELEISINLRVKQHGALADEAEEIKPKLKHSEARPAA